MRCGKHKVSFMALLRIHGNLVHFTNTNKMFVKMNSEMHKVSYMAMLKNIYIYNIFASCQLLWKMYVHVEQKHLEKLHGS